MCIRIFFLNLLKSENLSMQFQIKKCGLTEVKRAAAIFDRYRVAFGQTSNLPRSVEFISDRLSRNESVIFLAEQSNIESPIGFVQLYPSFASLAARSIWILNDLFVSPEFRRKGIATLLLDHVHAFGRETGALRVTLITEHANHEAQALYESLGYKLDMDYRRYTFKF